LMLLPTPPTSYIVHRTTTHHCSAREHAPVVLAGTVAAVVRLDPESYQLTSAARPLFMESQPPAAAVCDGCPALAVTKYGDASSFERAGVPVLRWLGER
jgi:hypothetical protein